MKLSQLLVLFFAAFMLLFAEACKQQAPKRSGSRADSDAVYGDDNDDDDYGRSDDDDDDDDYNGRSDDDDDDDDDLDSFNWTVLLSPEKYKDCKDKDKLYDRAAKECHTASIANFSCTKSEIISAFNSIDVTVDGDLSPLLDDDYEIDQCGESGSGADRELIVMLYKKFARDGKAGIKIKKICKDRSSLCD